VSSPTAQLPPRGDRQFRPQQIWAVIRKGWRLAAGFACATVLFTVFYTLSQKKIYRSTTSLQIDPTSVQPLGRQVEQVVEIGAGSYWTNKEYNETQFKIIQSQRLAVEVVRTLGLNKDPGFLGNLVPGAAAPPREVSVDAAARTLRGRLSVDPIRNSRMVNVSLDDADPARAQRILAALAEIYLEQNIQNALISTNSASDWLHGQLEKLKGDLESSELSLHGYKEEKQILSVSIDDQSNMLREEIKMFNDDLSHARAKREQIASRRDALAKVESSDPVDLPSTELLSSPVLQRIREDYLSAKKEREAFLGEGKGANHPDAKAADAKIGALKAALIGEVNNIKGAIDRDLAALDREISGLSRLFEEAKHRAMDLNLLEIEFRRLERTKNNNEKLYSLVLERAKESDLARMLRFNNIRIIDPPQTPGDPVRPQVPVNMAVGLFLGIAFGILAVLAREYLDRSIKTPDDVEEELGLTFLGLLPEIAANGKEPGRRYGRRRARRQEIVDAVQRTPELMAHYDSSSGLAEASRAIRTNLMFMAPDRPFRRLLITSAGPSEGKTMVACCVAVAMAQAGQRVLLVDCDLRRPRLHRVFKLNNETGVTAAMLDHSQIDAATIRTEIENLDVMSAGPHAPNPAELLQSEAFVKLLTELDKRYDRIVLDSPPVVPVTDPAVLSKHVDGTLLVIRAFKTTRDLTRQAVRSLRDVNAPMVGAILNAVDLSRREYGYYHYYYYKSEGYRPVPKVAST
jgi:capsular exopolysaccharide synthesis family protein